MAGAELLVKGAASIASRLGIPPVIVGLTVVAFGTSAPEFAVSLSAGLSGRSDVAFGNVVGSNIGNILLILGASAVVGGLAVSERIVRLDVPLLIGVSVLVLVLSLDNGIGRFDGALLFAGIIAYTAWLVRAARAGRTEAVEAEFVESVEAVEGATVERPLIVQIGFVLAGLVVLVLGSQFLVNAATDIAEALGVSELVIGLTVVAIGTSLPEFATSMLAAFRGQRDIAVGNVVGSNTFNLLGCLGVSALAAGSSGLVMPASVLNFDLWVMIAVALACLPVFMTGREIARWEGAVFVLYYVAYVLYLVLAAQQHDALGRFSMVMMSFVVPLTVITLVVVMLRRPTAGTPGS